MADLRTRLCGIDFPNPVWTAAGPTASDAAMMLRAARGGAGGLVTKTISVKPARVPQPNIWSPSPGSLLNAELWSELDYRNFLSEEIPPTRACGLPVIVSVGYTADDLTILGKAIESAHAADAVEFSIHYVDKDVSNLQNLARSLKNILSVPVLAKLSPAVQDLDAIVGALDSIVDGYVAVNSVGPALDFNPDNLEPVLGSADGRGWLSGRAIFPVGLHFVAALAQRTSKPVVGVGGVRSHLDIAKYILAGACAVQVCSLAIIKGQTVYGRLAADLARWMDDHGYPDIASMRGAFLRRKSSVAAVLGDGPQLRPAIAPQACTYCDICVKGCVHEALHFDQRVFHVDRERCVGCGLCVSLCPTGALSMRPE